MSSRIEPSTFGARLDRTQAALGTGDTERLVPRGEAADVLLVGVGPDLEWLLGYAATGHERLNLLVVPARGRVSLVVPRLEAPAAREAAGVQTGLVELATWSETDDPYALAASLVRRGAPGHDGDGLRLLVSDGLRASFLLRLQAVLPGSRWAPGSDALGPLRRAKSAEEVALLREAGAAADRTVDALFGGRLIGRTEADIAHEVRDRLVAEGHDEAGFAIVASGPNSASPHHEAGTREVRAGEPLLLDIGGRLGGYCSDITRTAWLRGPDGPGPDEAFVRLHGLVEAAQAAARRAVRPGFAREDLDRVARTVIEAGGMGEHFFHRLGHGIGLEVHEEPYIVEGAPDPILEGDAFSIEPGIYLEGRYGARIEDIVVCTPAGADALNRAGRSLRIVGGS